MRTDPRKACANENQLLGWAIVHDLIARPFMVMTGYSRLSLRFHDATSRLAWPRNTAAIAPFELAVVPNDRWGRLFVTRTPAGFYEIKHPAFAHRFGVKAINIDHAVEQAEEWFASLVDLIPGSEVRP